MDFHWKYHNLVVTGSEMKVRCRREKFVPLFNLIASFTSTRDVRPALQNVKMVADDNKLVLTATDGNLGAQGELSVDDGFVVESSGEAILPAKLLRKILTETTDEEIALELDGTTLGVRGANFRYQLTTWSANDFPTVSAFEETAYHKISTKSLSEMIRRTSFATDAENAHYSLGGVLFDFAPDRITSVATDGRRLAFQTRSAEAVGDHAPADTIVFPPKALNLIERAAGEVEEALIAIKEAQALIQLGNVVVSTTLMEGRFPKWRQIVPDKSGRIHVDFIAGQLASAVRQAEIVATEKKPGVWFNFSSGKVSVAAAGDEVGESNVDIPIAYDGEASSIRLDPRFLNEFFRCLPAEETISFYFLQADKATLFETSDDYAYVVMPLN